ncbi:hypothetical protein HGRIS_000873 [Hohenbuehelia grisea]|uniref:Uncharacterized protein n=1 Tax=Hohenbuehelia grisea TaxID=104357 RepID=A0ABR3IQ49_9AGAR
MGTELALYDAPPAKQPSGCFLSLPTSQEIQACWELCRLHNNIGFWVVYLPTTWSIALAYHAQSDLPGVAALARAAVYVPLCFGVKSLIMTIDDILDYDIDGLVERTKGRPIPRGAITLPRAWLFFALQSVIGIALALKLLSTRALYVSMPVWPLYVIYPTCKRWTNLAPVPLGAMFNIGVLMGWADLSLDGHIPWETLLPIYFGACLWTFTYETVYQHQDKVDDVKIGVNSPALLCGDYTIPITTATSIGFLGLLVYGGIANGQGWPYFVGVSIAGAMLLVKLAQTNIDNPHDCRDLFLGTVSVGQVILAGLVIDVVAQRLMDGIPL